MMTRKQIDASREARLWICQVAVPTIGLMVMVGTNPVIRSWVDDKTSKVKRKIKTIFKK